MQIAASLATHNKKKGYKPAKKQMDKITRGYGQDTGDAA